MVNNHSLDVTWKDVAEMTGKEKLIGLVEYSMSKNAKASGDYASAVGVFEITRVNHYCNLTLQEVEEVYKGKTFNLVDIETSSGEANMRCSYHVLVSLVDGDVNLEVFYEMKDGVDFGI